MKYSSCSSLSHPPLSGYHSHGVQQDWHYSVIQVGPSAEGLYIDLGPRAATCKILRCKELLKEETSAVEY